jgi:hypothetical protein
LAGILSKAEGSEIGAILVEHGRCGIERA